MALHLKRNKTKLVIYSFFIILLILLLLSWLYIFNIYEIGISVNQLSSLNYVVKVEPKNSLGKNAPFRNVNYSYEVSDGVDNIKEIVDKGDGQLFLILKSDTIKVKLRIRTNKTQNISVIEIPTHKME